MSAVIPEQKTLYARLCELPENLVGEIINGELYTQPRPAGPHANATSVLGMEIGSAFHQGRGGPGGWWITFEPELHFVRDVEVLVPDLAGWRRERLPRFPQDQRFEIVPDWVCEVLSPSTAQKDRIAKIPVYAHYGVGYLWLVDPLARTLEAYGLQDHQWSVTGLFKDADRVSVEPFRDITFSLADLWIEA
jgi:Uma2 family endonuclease